MEGGGFASTWFDDEHPLSTKQTAARGEAVLQNATLPERMRAAAEVLVEASRRYDSERGSVVTNFAATSWDAANLTLVADRWEAADAAEAEKDRLARELADAFRLRADDGATALAIARELVADGWTKGEKAP